MSGLSSDNRALLEKMWSLNPDPSTIPALAQVLIEDHWEGFMGQNTHPTPMEVLFELQNLRLLTDPDNTILRSLMGQ